MGIQPNTLIINSIPIQLYEWIIITEEESCNSITIGVIAISIEQARNLLLSKLEQQVPLANGLAVADVNFLSPLTEFPETMDRLEMCNQENVSYRFISRAVLEASIATSPRRVVPIDIGTTILFSETL